MPHPILDSNRPILIGMLHVPPLPGSPQAAMPLQAIREFVLRDAEALIEGGISNLMLENFGDTPFFPGTVPAHTVAHLTAIASEVAARFPTAELGINVLRNDGCAALAIAAATGASFVRVNVLSGARLTDQGIIQGIAHDLLRLRKQLAATGVAILADVDVKHSAAITQRPLSDEIDDAIKRGHADAIIVSGNSTGATVDKTQLTEAVAAAHSTPVLLGSGVTAESINKLVGLAAGCIIGTAVKRDGNVNEQVEAQRVREIVAAST
jgi:uncharacterized protein